MIDLTFLLSDFGVYPLEYAIMQFAVTDEFKQLRKSTALHFSTWWLKILNNEASCEVQCALYTQRKRLLLKASIHSNNIYKISLYDIGVELIKTPISARVSLDDIAAIEEATLAFYKGSQCDIKLCPRCNIGIVYIAYSQTHTPYWTCNRRCGYTSGIELDGMTCPKCESPMQLRKAQRGYYKGNLFWGCSSYPQCKHIIKCEEQHWKAICRNDIASVIRDSLHNVDCQF